MTAMCRALVLRLTILLAAATAAADTVVTTHEVIACRVASADADLVRLQLPMHRSRALHTHDVYEIRLSNPGRVAAMAALLPRTWVTIDSGQSLPSSEARAQALADRWAEVEADDSNAHAGTIDTLPRKALPAEMAARCLELRAALTECGRSDDTVAELLHDIVREERALRSIRSQASTHLVCGPSGGLLGGSVGAWVGFATAETPVSGLGCAEQLAGCSYGLAAGGALGAVAGLVIGTAWRENLIANHRQRLNDLVRRVNRAIVATP